MIDGTKQNMRKLFTLVMKKVDGEEETTADPQTESDAPTKTASQQEKHRAVKTELLKIFARKLNKNIQKLEDSTPQKNAQAEIA